MNDLYSDIEVRRSISPVAVSGTTAQVGQVIEHTGAVTYCISIGEISDPAAEFVVLLLHGDTADFVDEVELAPRLDAQASAFRLAGVTVWPPRAEFLDCHVADKQMSGTQVLASFGGGDSHKQRKLGYIGCKKYTRLIITPWRNEGSAVIAAHALLS